MRHMCIFLTGEIDDRNATVLIKGGKKADIDSPVMDNVPRAI